MPGMTPAARIEFAVSDAQVILFYDGGCGLCARSVRWALRHDRRGRVRFAPLQGQTLAGLVSTGKPENLESVVLARDGALLVRSEAVLGLARELGGPWAALAAAGKLIPKGLADWLYDRIAARRMVWFGAADACQFPAPEHAGRFLP